MDGLTTLQSNFGPEETMTRLEAEIKSRGMTVFSRVNHAALAAEAGMALRPTEVIMFGNPRGGTPLMQASQTIGIDLPLKMLVWQDAAGKTWLSYNEPVWLAKRHELAGVEKVVTAMTTLLAGLAAKAAGDISEKGTPGASVKPAIGTDGTGTPVAEPDKSDNTHKADKSTEPDRVSPVPITKLPPANLLPRLMAIGVIIAGIAFLFAYAGGWLTPYTLTPARLADTLEQVNGTHPGFRRNHAKGVCVSGYFTSNGQGASLSKAAIFQPGRVPVIGRFSLSGGQPYAADAVDTVRGLAIRFKFPDGEEWRTAMINLPVFLVRTPQAFRDLLLATAPDPATGKPDPARVQALLAKYPESARALQVIHGQPKCSGFDNSTFNSLNAFQFINAAGQVTPVRWSMVPVMPYKPAGAEPAIETNKNQLFDALIAAIHQQPLEWRLVVTVGQPGDPADDATIPWPPDRQQVDVGTLTIDQVQSDDTSPARDINFDPLVLPDGISPSNDPLLSARSAVYSQSFTRREGEQKKPAAVSPEEAANEHE